MSNQNDQQDEQTESDDDNRGLLTEDLPAGGLNHEEFGDRQKQTSSARPKGDDKDDEDDS